MTAATSSSHAAYGVSAVLHTQLMGNVLWCQATLGSCCPRVRTPKALAFFCCWPRSKLLLLPLVASSPVLEDWRASCAAVAVVMAWVMT